MLNLEFEEGFNDDLACIVDEEFNKFAEQNGVNCNYTPFTIIAKENEKILGIIKGHSYYKEVHIGDLIVFEENRNKHIGSKLVEEVEKQFKNKGFENINLTTYAFEAPEFYKKCGYEIEFIRENKNNPKLTKYFLVKYF